MQQQQPQQRQFLSTLHIPSKTELLVKEQNKCSSISNTFSLFQHSAGAAEVVLHGPNVEHAIVATNQNGSEETARYDFTASTKAVVSLPNINSLGYFEVEFTDGSIVSLGVDCTLMSPDGSGIGLFKAIAKNDYEGMVVQKFKVSGGDMGATVTEKIEVGIARIEHKIDIKNIPFEVTSPNPNAICCITSEDSKAGEYSYVCVSNSRYYHAFSSKAGHHRNMLIEQHNLTNPTEGMDEKKLDETVKAQMVNFEEWYEGNKNLFAGGYFLD